jgi:DNA-binding NarL/FixJ family response regulator
VHIVGNDAFADFERSGAAHAHVLANGSDGLFDLDIEQSYRDWMLSMLGEERGQEFLRKRLKEIPVGKMRWGQTDDLDLSSRERECLTLMACGYTRKEVGAVLHLSFETVKQYLDRARIKMRANTTTQAAFIAILVGELDHALMGEHLFRHWESGLARPGRPIAA